DELLAAVFALGAKPTGSYDPFGLRRAALGVVSILREHPRLEPVTLERGLSEAAERLRAQGVEVPPDVVDSVVEFVVGRYVQQLLNEGADYGLVEAVRPGAGAPWAAYQTLRALPGYAADPGFRALVTAVQRVARILPPGTAARIEPSLLTEPAERALIDAVEKVGAAGPRDLAGFAEHGQQLVEPINTFFDDILVMTDDADVRQARLGLLAAVLELAPSTIDWQALDSALQ
ncbi:MAG: glycine--tRNA ligase subunit beta, partial [Jiangellaceae bacterium]